MPQYKRQSAIDKMLEQIIFHVEDLNLSEKNRQKIIEPLFDMQHLLENSLTSNNTISKECFLDGCDNSVINTFCASHEGEMLSQIREFAEEISRLKKMKIKTVEVVKEEIIERKITERQIIQNKKGEYTTAHVSIIKAIRDYEKLCADRSGHWTGCTKEKCECGWSIVEDAVRKSKV